MTLHDFARHMLTLPDMPIQDTKDEATTGAQLQSHFVHEIQKHLKGAGVQDQTMCEKAGLSPQHWSNIKSRFKGLTLDMLARIATACGKKVTITLQ